MNSDVAKRVKEIQNSMMEDANSCFDESELRHLRAVIRLTVEFRDYLEHGSVEVAQGLKHGPHAGYFKDLQTASADPFNKYDLEYVCGSIRSLVDSFCSLTATYRILNGATDSNLKWSMISSKDAFKIHFFSIFAEFSVEANVENKCRFLLDLFKLQIVFAGLSCG
jgi:hypothetical protein